MAKKSTTKTTAKKKTASKKKKATTAKTVPKKPAAKKTAKPTKPSAESKAGTTGAKKKPAAKKTDGTPLWQRQFDRWAPETVYSPPADAMAAERFSAPDLDPDGSLKPLLQRKFDFDPAAVARPPRPKRTRSELLRMTFPRWQPAALYEAPDSAADSGGFTAPPADPAGGLKAFLFRKFDFDFAAVARPPKPKRTLRELLQMQFARWQPEQLYAPGAAGEAVFTAPPADPDGSLGSLLRRTFDFDFEAEAAKAAAVRKAAEEKAAAERKAAEAKAAAEKAEAERKAAEAARKAEEERAAAEKAEAERKAAEAARKAEEARAAAEKAEAERKAKAAQEAAERAEAERIAAEVKVPPDPMERAVKYMVAGLLILFTLIIAASYSNSCRFYIVPDGDEVEIYQGRFAPIGKKEIIELSGAEMPETLKAVYTRAEAYTVVFDHLIGQADQLLAAPTPDLNAVVAVLDRAEPYAFTDAHQKGVETRQTTASLMGYLFQTDAAASKGDPAALADAVERLEAAKALPLTEIQRRLVEEKMQLLQGLMEGAEATGASEQTPEGENAAHGSKAVI